MLKKFLQFVINIIPLKNIIIFESNPDFSDNTYWLFKYLVEKEDIRNNFKLVWFLNDYNNKKPTLCNVPIICLDNFDDSFFNKLKKLYFNSIAKIIIDCNDFVPKRRNSQLRIHLTHGMPIKNCSEYFKLIGDCDFLPVMGDKFVTIFSSFVKRESIYLTGLPRNDILCSGIPRYKECFIIWMPTYRQNKNLGTDTTNIFPLGIPVFQNIEELHKLNIFLKKNNIKLLLRMHPVQDLSVLKIEEMSNIVIADDSFLKANNITLYELLAYSWGLITDYSSVYFDYLLIDRPIGLTVGDVDVYTRKNGLLFENIKKELPAFYIDDLSDLQQFLKEVINLQDDFKSERNQFMKKNNIKQQKSCKLIYEHIKRFI